MSAKERKVNNNEPMCVYGFVLQQNVRFVLSCVDRVHGGGGIERLVISIVLVAMHVQKRKTMYWKAHCIPSPSLLEFLDHAACDMPSQHTYTSCVCRARARAPSPMSFSTWFLHGSSSSLLGDVRGAPSTC